MAAEPMAAQPMRTDPNTGLAPGDRKALAGVVASVLADTYVLMVRTQAYHWNVVGPLFYSLHKLTEEHYRNMFEAVDDLAERVRALGHIAPFSTKDMLHRAATMEHGGVATTQAMVESLIDQHRTVAQRMREAVEFANQQNDVVTADLLTNRMGFHEEAVWMLQAMITR